MSEKNLVFIPAENLNSEDFSDLGSCTGITYDEFVNAFADRKYSDGLKFSLSEIGALAQIKGYLKLSRTCSAFSVVLNIKDGLSYFYDATMSTEEKTGRITVEGISIGLAAAGLVATGPLALAAAGTSAILGAVTYYCADDGAFYDFGDTLIGIKDGISNFANLFEVVEKSTENIYNGYDDEMKVTTYEIKLSESGAELWRNIMNKRLSVNKCAA